MEIDVYFDIVCPWCYIGKRRLARALEERPNFDPSIRWRAFLLNPNMPPEGVDRDFYLVRKFGSEARVRRIQGTLLEAGHSVEIPFAFDRIRRTPNTVSAHRMAFFAERENKAAEAIETMFRAFFLEGRDIGDSRILADLGEEIGLNRSALISYLETGEDVDRVADENARAHRLGVNGVPAFVFNGHFVISGAQDAQVLIRLLDAANATGRETGMTA
ncbi:MAG: DsbA family oxidoreductase [Alphaproteobacteria bacterium]|nr:DsbA family oxidoreductase [Alphaproteobacteria bacterium]